MEKEEKNNDRVELTLSLRPSFREAISRAERQVEYKAMVLDGMVSPELAHEICAVIAEVYMFSPDRQIRISGEWLDGYMVQEIFGELTREHAEMVMTEFCRLVIDVRNKKAYLRTALYNSVFTLEAHYTNRVNHDLKG